MLYQPGRQAQPPSLTGWEVITGNENDDTLQLTSDARYGSVHQPIAIPH